MRSEQLQISEFLIGTGFFQTRHMNGSIKDFNASINFQKSTPMAIFYSWLLIPFSFLGILLGFWLTLRLLKLTNQQESNIKPVSSRWMNRLKEIQYLNLYNLHSATLSVLAFLIVCT